MAARILTVGCLTSLLGLATAVLSIASSMWVRIRYPYIKNDIGLMRHCDVDSDYCGDMDRINMLLDTRYTGWFRSVQALYVLHVLGHLTSFCFYILYLVRFFETKNSFKALTVFNFATMSFGLYSVCVFGTNYIKFFGLSSHPMTDQYAGLNWAFYTAILGCVFGFLTTIFSAIEASESAGVIHNMQHRLTQWSTPYTLFMDQDRV